MIIKTFFHIKVKINQYNATGVIFRGSDDEDFGTGKAKNAR